MARPLYPTHIVPELPTPAVTGHRTLSDLALAGSGGWQDLWLDSGRLLNNEIIRSDGALIIINTIDFI
jgi:hypothetical protein